MVVAIWPAVHWGEACIVPLHHHSCSIVRMVGSNPTKLETFIFVSLHLEFWTWRSFCVCICIVLPSIIQLFDCIFVFVYISVGRYIEWLWGVESMRCLVQQAFLLNRQCECFLQCFLYLCFCSVFLYLCFCSVLVEQDFPFNRQCECFFVFVFCIFKLYLFVCVLYFCI